MYQHATMGHRSKTHKQARNDMSIQETLEKATNKLVSDYGVEQAVSIIKAKRSAGIFSSMSNYPAGVFIHCNSEKGGVLVGATK